MTPQVGTVLRSRYTLERQLGKNATRQTWLAEDRDRNCKVVVKMLAFNLQLQWQEVKLFEREAQALQKLDHPRIPKYLDYFTLNGVPDWFVLVQTYIPGESLQTLLVRGERFDEERLQQIATDVLSLLIYLHDRQPPILHRDIKPSNLIAGAGRQTYLVDFGAAQIQPAQMGTFTVVGTYGYTPMEQFGGRAIPASDLFALGATLVHLATGVPPADLPQALGKLYFRDRTQLSSGFIEWLEKAIEPNVSLRYASARIASLSLQSINRPLNKSISKSNISIERKSQSLKRPKTDIRQKSSSIEPESRMHSVASQKADINRSLVVKPDKEWHQLSSVILDSRIRYKETEDNLEINFKAYIKSESLKNDELPGKNLLKKIDITTSILFIYLASIPIQAFVFKGISPLVSILNWIVVVVFFGLMTVGYLVEESEYNLYGRKIVVNVSCYSISFYDFSSFEMKTLYRGEIACLKELKLYGIGNAFSDEPLSLVSASITTTDSVVETVDLNASLRPSELEWMQKAINDKIKSFKC